MKIFINFIALIASFSLFACSGEIRPSSVHFTYENSAKTIDFDFSDFKFTTSISDKASTASAPKKSEKIDKNILLVFYSSDDYARRADMKAMQNLNNLDLEIIKLSDDKNLDDEAIYKMPNLELLNLIALSLALQAENLKLDKKDKNKFFSDFVDYFNAFKTRHIDSDKPTLNTNLNQILSENKFISSISATTYVLIDKRGKISAIYWGILPVEMLLDNILNDLKMEE